MKIYIVMEVEPHHSGIVLSAYSSEEQATAHINYIKWSSDNGKSYYIKEVDVKETFSSKNL